MFGRSRISRTYVFAPVFILAALQLTSCTRVAPAPPGGVYRSESAGGNFEQSVDIAGEEGSYIAQFPLQSIDRPSFAPDSIYIAAGDKGIVTSFDDGKTWTVVATPLTYTSDVLLLENKVLVATGVDGKGQGFVIRSLDDGKSWQSVFTVPVPKEQKGLTIIGNDKVSASVVLSIERDPFNPDRIYGGSSLGTLFVGQQSAKVWSTLQTIRSTKPSPAQTQSQIAIAKLIVSPETKGELLVITQSGALLRIADGKQEEIVVPQYISTPPPPLTSGGQRKVLDVTYIPGYPDALMIGTTTGAVVTRDKGESWVELNVPVETNDAFNSAVVRVSPTNVSRMFVGVNGVVYRSEDGGNTWNTFALGLPDHAIIDISINPSNAAKMLLVVRPLS